MNSVFVWTTGDVFGLIVFVTIAVTLIPMYIKDWWRNRK